MLAPWSSPIFRVGVHVRMDDMHIAAARDGASKFDTRNPDIKEFHFALHMIGEKLRTLTNRRSLVIFACADTAEARTAVRAALSPFSVVMAPYEPVHTGYKGDFQARWP